MKIPTLADIQAARERIRTTIFRTPLKESHYVSQLVGCQVYLKLENLQHTGSFKVRGAGNRLLTLSEAEKKRGVIAASAGNHAQGVAYQASKLGMASTIVMPTHAPLGKTEATRGYGAEVILHGQNYDEAYAEACKIQKARKLTFVHAYADPFVIAGQGTLGLEILEQLPKMDAIVVPVGGGGLISGIAIAVKSLNPKIKVYGVQPTQAASMAMSWKKGKIVNLEHISTMAEGLAVKKPSSYVLDILKKYVDDMITVEEEEMASAILFLMEKVKIVVEGAGSAGMAALLHNKIAVGKKRVAVVLSGGNIDVTTISRIIERGLRKTGRLLQIKVHIKDRPGVLRDLATLVAAAEGNILQVYHDRSRSDLPIGEAEVALSVETKGPEHQKKLTKSLQKNRYTFQVV